MGSYYPQAPEDLVVKGNEVVVSDADFLNTISSSVSPTIIKSVVDDPALEPKVGNIIYSTNKPKAGKKFSMQFDIQTVNGVALPYKVVWGDGTVDTGNGVGRVAFEHVYRSPGTYNPIVEF